MRFNGVDLRSVHRALSIEKEIPPGTAVHAFETIDTKDGAIITDERLEAGEYIVRVNIVGRTPEEGWAVREMLAGWATTRGLKTSELIPTHNTKRCYDAKLKSISDPEFIRGGAKVAMRFAVPRPVARDVTESRASGAGGVSARIGGTYTCRPVLSQALSAAQDGLVWVMDGMPILTVKGALSAGQVVRMDVKNESLTIDGEHAEARINIDGTRWQPGWHPGAHVISSTDGGAFEMRWHNEWA